MIPRPRLRLCVKPATLPIFKRCFSSSQARPTTAGSGPPPQQPAAVPQRWLSDLQSRIGRCLMFGCSPAQTLRAAVVVRALATEWRELTAGSEGFLTGGRRGLEDHEVVWGTMDSFQHVNNVTYIRYAESSRVNWMLNFALHVDPANAPMWRELMTPQSTGLILQALSVDFKLPIVYPDKISVYHKLRSAPAPVSDGTPAQTAFQLDCIVLSHLHRRVAARLAENIVTYDYRAGRKAEVPSFVRTVFADTYRLQAEETARAQSRIRELYGLVEGLEKETWDRADAVEDVGSSAKA